VSDEMLAGIEFEGGIAEMLASKGFQKLYRQAGKVK
jgi:hypothetical protein